MSAGARPTPGDLRRPDRPDTPGQEAAPDPRVVDALSRLDELDGLPLSDQVDVFTDIHRRLAAVLADPDSQA